MDTNSHWLKLLNAIVILNVLLTDIMKKGRVIVLAGFIPAVLV